MAEGGFDERYNVFHAFGNKGGGAWGFEGRRLGCGARPAPDGKSAAAKPSGNLIGEMPKGAAFATPAFSLPRTFAVHPNTFAPPPSGHPHPHLIMPPGFPP